MRAVFSSRDSIGGQPQRHAVGELGETSGSGKPLAAFHGKRRERNGRIPDPAIADGNESFRQDSRSTELIGAYRLTLFLRGT